jgi:iron complex outermembrane receptor protein
MQMIRKRTKGILLATAAIAATSGAIPVRSEAPLSNTYHLKAQDLSSALRAVGRISGREIMFPADAVAGKQAPSLDGNLTAAQAIDQLLAGSGLIAEDRGDVVLIRGRSKPATTPAEAELPETAPILVTGSRIRGVPIASPTITLSRQQITEAGQTSVGDAMRDLPQNFSGGQNPGVAGGGDQGNLNNNINSSSTINLRGLGPDATLTLINGHRVAYDGISQGVDVDQIPVAALDRIEIVADGASALYGSDAVGGVANILLKKDYDGLNVSARLGAATDGGDEQQQYDLTTGRRWNSGGMMFAFDIRRSTAIDASQRSYTQTLQGSSTLLPWQHQYGGVITGHQDVGDRVHLEVDATYNHRISEIILPTTTTDPVTVNGSDSTTREKAFSITPKVIVEVGGNWTATLNGTYGVDDTSGLNRQYSDSENTLNGGYRYKDRTQMVEVSAEGPLLHIPAGDIRLAFGGGYRSSRLVAHFTPDTELQPQGTRTSYYGFAEINIPVISPQQDIVAVNSLSISGAVRYEDYPGMASLATPKLGLIFAPTPDLDIKGSWGKSFKTPTLYQQIEAQEAVLVPTSAFGSNSYPTGSTALFLSGGNANLKPERAKSWSATADFHPRFLPGSHLEFSYFNINYRDRIVSPVTSVAGVLTNPLYADLVINAPSEAFLNALVAATPGGITNYSGSPYTPANVVAVVDDRYLNVARQIVHGFDVASRYTFDIHDFGNVTASADVSYLATKEQLSALQPLVPIAGTIFNAPHWRGRGGLIWRYGDLTLTSYVTYIGSVRDTRFTPIFRVHGMASVDLTATQHIHSANGAFNGMDLILSVLNVQNVKPAIIRNTTIYDPTYDSANYSSVGRFVSLTISKSF